ncbi:MAG: trigger factor [Candidatus Obscuribacterales bacterium]|nr:trigger factor [Candidatus Obscuribacterales bacterium]
MKVTLEREGKNVVKLGIELEAERVKRAYEMACRELSKQVRIPGFRPGKAPRMILEKTIGEDNIKNEALQSLVPEVISEAVLKENLDLITAPEYSKVEFKLGEPLKLEAKFEVRPEVKLGKYKELEVNVPEVTLPADALERALANVAETRSSLAPVEGRASEMGDTVVLDFKATIDGEPMEGGNAESFVMELKEGAFLPNFCEQIVGKSKGDQFDVKASFPENYRRKDVAGKEAVFAVVLKEIRRKFVPDINDELAKAVGHESLDALKESLRGELDELVKQENEARAQRMVVEAVSHCAEVDIPETMIQREKELLVNQMRRYMEQQGQSFDEVASNPDFQQVIASKDDEAKQRVLTSLVLGAVVRAENITVEEDEMGPYFADLAMRYNLRPDQYQEFAANQEVRRQVAEEVLTGKVVELLVSSAKINYVADTECSDEHDHSVHEKKETEAAKS